ncbi:cache domain-containing protein [soil metagenome]
MLTRRIHLKLMVLSLLSVSMLPVWAEEHGSATEAQAMVQKTITAMKKNGVENIITEINKRDGQYKDRDLYVVVYNLEGKNLAHLNPKMVGKDMMELTDSDGKYFIKERLQIAKKKGSGWQDYKFVNPVSKQIEPKSMYIEKYDNVIVGCGIYK